jgi:hypothetical protein
MSGNETHDAKQHMETAAYLFGLSLAITSGWVNIGVLTSSTITAARWPLK